MTTTAQIPRSGPFTGNGSTLAFTYGFQVDASTELVVVVRNTTTNVITTKTLTTDYSVAGVGVVSGGTVTFVTAPTSTEEVAFIRAVPLTQGLDLQNLGVVSPELLEDQLDTLTRITQDNSEAIGRAIKTDLFSVVDQAQLTLDLDTVAGISSDVTTVAGIAADVSSVAASGADTAAVSAISPEVVIVAGIAADVVALAADGNVATLAAISTDVTTVAGIAANVTTVSGIAANVTTVAGIAADVTTVAADRLDTAVVAGISGNVSTVAGIAAAVTTVAADGTDIGVVAGISGNVTTVAGIAADVTTVAADGTDIGVVSGISGNVTTVAGISTGVTTVAGIAAAVTTVAADGTDIGVVAGISGNVSTVAGIAANVTTVAGISADVTAVSGISGNVTTVAADGVDIGVVAGISGNVSTVAGIAAAVTTVAADGTDIGVVAGISGNVSTVAGIAAAVTTVAADGTDIGVVAGISSDVTTVASNIVAVQGASAEADAAAASAALAEDYAASITPYASRAAAIAATVPAAVTRILVYSVEGDTLAYKEDALGTALTTAGAQKWSPDGMATPQHFGAETSITDNTAALNAWAQYIARGSANTATGGNDGGGTGTFRHTGQIIFPICDDLKIEGNRLEFNYTGASTTLNPIWRMGASNGESRRWRIANLKVTSDTTMTAGDGLLAERVMTSSFRDVTIDGQHGTGKLWNGIWMKDCGTFFWDGFDCRSQNENMVLSGSVGKGQAEYRFENGRSLLGDIGFHIAGGVGGVYLGGDFIQNRENLRVSTERSAVINREIFIQSDGVFDSTTAGGYSVNVVDTLTQQGGWLNFASPWIASGDAAALRIGPSVAMRITLNGGNVFNAGAVHAGTGHNILCESSLVRLTLTGTLIRDARGTGINLTVANPYYQAHDVYFTGNVTDFSANGRPQSTIAVDGKTFNAQLRMGAYGTEGGEIRFNDAAGALGGTLDVTSAGGDFRFRNSKSDSNAASIVLSQTNDMVFNGNMGMGIKPINALRALPYSFAIGDGDTGIGQNGDGILELFANNAYRVRVEPTSVSVQPNLRCFSSVEVTGNIFAPDNTSTTVIFGGTNNNGANLELYGGSHASLANLALLDADRTLFRAAAGGTTGVTIDHLAATPATIIAMQLNLGQSGGEGGEMRFQNASNASYDYIIDVSGTDLFRIRRGPKIFMSMDAAGFMKFDRPTFADNAAAVVGGVPVGADYRTATGEVRVVV